MIFLDQLRFSKPPGALSLTSLMNIPFAKFSTRRGLWQGPALTFRTDVDHFRFVPAVARPASMNALCSGSQRVRPLARLSCPWAICLRALEERCTHEDIVFKFRSVSSKLIISPKSTPQERLDSDAVGCSSEPTVSLLAQVCRLRLKRP